MKKISFLLLVVILSAYSFLYVATTYHVPCEGDCEIISNLNTKMSNGHRAYLQYIQRCSRVAVSDTICVYVKDTTGINWNMVADSTCFYANMLGLQRQKVFVIRQTVPWDTVARKQCQ